MSDTISVFYLYDKSVARKWADVVCLKLKHVFENIHSPTVKHIIVFCDSCAGQNKNFMVMRFCTMQFIYCTLTIWNRESGFPYKRPLLCGGRQGNVSHQSRIVYWDTQWLEGCHQKQPKQTVTFYCCQLCRSQIWNMDGLFICSLLKCALCQQGL